MLAHIDESQPIVGVFNNTEVIHDFLSLANASDQIQIKQNRGDRALMWLGSHKLVFTSSLSERQVLLQHE